METAIDSFLNKPIKTKWKAILKVTWVLKKLKNIDDPIVVKEAKIIALGNNWLIKKGNPLLDTKARIEKATDAKKKLVKKQVKA